MAYRLFCMIRKELLELWQDPKMLRVVLVAPVVQLALLGYAATTDVRNVPIVVVDADRSAPSRELVARFERSRYFTVEYEAGSTNGIDDFLESGKAWMALSIPRGYGDRVAGGIPATVQVVADGTDSNSTTVALGYATSLVSSYGAELAALSGRSTVVPAGGIEAQLRIWFNPELESRDFMIPGVLALLLLVISATLAAMALVREKERGTLEQLNVTPLGRVELIAGKLLPFAAICMVDVALVVAVAVFWFQVPFHGSVALLFGVSLVYLVGTLGLGLFVSTISQTQQQAMMTAVFFFIMPMIFLSGFVFPIENMPAAIQPVTYLIPLRYYLEIVRGIFLKGIGLETLWPQALSLLGWGVAILALAVARSTKRLG
jgi:ABC-2 type transport system permease protein